MKGFDTRVGQALAGSVDAGSVTEPEVRDTVMSGSMGSLGPQTASNHKPEALIGRIIDGKYRIDSILGSGGMSVVYKAWEIFLNKYVALKVLRPHMLSYATSSQRFQQEARAASNLNHPNVVAVYSYGVRPMGRPI